MAGRTKQQQNTKKDITIIFLQLTGKIGLNIYTIYTNTYLQKIIHPSYKKTHTHTERHS